MPQTRMVYLGAGLAAFALALTAALVVWLRADDRPPVRADVKYPPPGANLVPPPVRTDTPNPSPGANLSPTPVFPSDPVTQIAGKGFQPRPEEFGHGDPNVPEKPIRADAKDPPPAAKDPPPGAKLAPTAAPADTAITEIEGKSLRQWTEEIGNEDPSVREKAIRAVIFFGSQAATSRVIDALVARCTSDPEASPRVRAVIALTVLDIPEPDHHKVIDALAKCLDGHLENGRMVFNDPQAVVRYHAAVALNRFGGDEAKSAIPGLINGTRDLSSFETRRACVTALRQIARDPKKGPDPKASRALLSMLASPGGIPNENAVEVKIEAIMSLAAMGRPGSEDEKLLKEIEATLLAYINSRDRRLSIWAHYSQLALQIDPKTDAAHVKAIADNCTSPDVVTKVHTATALGAIGTKAQAHTGALIKLLGDKDNEVFVATCQAFVNIVDPGKDAIKALTDLAEPKENVEPKIDPGRKEWAKATLEHIAEAKKNRDKMDKDEPKKDREVKKDK